jgi:hypothetical protein
MHPVLGICPVCGDVLTITRLHCRTCDTTIEGQFFTGRLSQLTPEQLQFVEVFMQCEGKIKAVEEKLGISYPTVRSRLRDVIVAMGYDVTPEDDEAALQTEELRRQVLEDLEAGKISTEDAIARLHSGA